MQMFLKSRAGAVRLATPLMILCFLAMGGFLYWLSTYAPPEPQDMPTGDGEVLNEVDFADFSVATQVYMEQEITLRNVGVTAMIGERLFWTNIVNDELYLLFVSESAAADSVDVAGLPRVDITGSVMPLTDSLIDAWFEAGVFANENDRFQAEFALDKGDYFEIWRFEIEDGEEGENESDESGESDDEDPAESGDPPS